MSQLVFQATDEVALFNINGEQEKKQAAKKEKKIIQRSKTGKKNLVVFNESRYKPQHMRRTKT